MEGTLASLPKTLSRKRTLGVQSWHSVLTSTPVYSAEQSLAGLHLWRAGYAAYRADAGLRPGLVGRRLAGVEFPGEAAAESLQALRRRVADELKTTFASHYAAEISLAEALQPEVIASYRPATTGQKYLINPSRGL